MRARNRAKNNRTKRCRRKFNPDRPTRSLSVLRGRAKIHALIRRGVRINEKHYAANPLVRSVRRAIHNMMGG